MSPTLTKTIDELALATSEALTRSQTADRAANALKLLLEPLLDLLEDQADAPPSAKEFRELTEENRELIVKYERILKDLAELRHMVGKVQ